MCLKLLKFFFVLTEKQISGHHFNDLHFIQVKNNPRSCEVNLCNCVRSLKKFRTSTGSRFFFFFFFFLFLFQACIAFTTARIILHFISFPQFSYMIYFIYICHITFHRSLKSLKYSFYKCFKRQICQV